MDKFKFLIPYVLLSIVAITIMILSFTYAIEFSSFGVGMVKYCLSLGLVWFIDRFAFREVNTIQLIKSNPVAYALFLFGNFVLASACISAS